MGGGKSGQKNKGHKHGKHASKNSLKEKAKGRVAIMAGLAKTHRAPKSLKGGVDPGSKHKRMQQQQARVKDKRDVLLKQLRTGRKGAPKVIGFIPVGDTTDQKLARMQVQKLCDESAPLDGVATVKTPQFNQTFQLLHSTDNAQDQLDLAKVCDIVVIVCRVNTDDDVDPNAIEPDLPDDKTVNTWFSELGLSIDDSGRQLLSTLNCQGIPSVCIVLQGLNLIPNARKRKNVERLHLRYFQSIMTADIVPKVFCTDTVDKAALTLRYLCEQKLRSVKWRDVRPYFLVDKCEWMDEAAAPTPAADGTPSKMLNIGGFLRGKPLSANRLIHLTNYGTYQIEKISDRDGNVIATPDEGQEALQYCQVPDPMANEQTWPTDEELKEAERLERKSRKEKSEKVMKVKVPEGFSSYQAAWVADPQDFEEIGSSEDDESAGDDDKMDTKSRATTKYSRVSSAAQTDVEEAVGGNWLAADEAMSDEQRLSELLRLKEASKDDAEFPDEVETPVHIPSRIRFQKYRGLQSFRTSTWDANESLPVDYARIFKFGNFKRTQKISLATLEGGEAERYVVVTLRAVPAAFFEKYNEREGSPLIASGLLPHEQKYTVLHFLMQRNKEYDVPIKSKSRLVINMGFRKVVANPIYSEPCKGARTKFSRYFHADDKFIMMSFFGPASYLPTPALCFQPTTKAEKDAGADMPFVSFGSAELPNPDLLLLKKIVLTGHVYKTHKRQSIVRFMFHNEDDVKWFQPVELYTKLGFRGRILKSVGTHGYMKCTFSGIVQGHDVVCMDLWKRVFPKWTTATFSYLAEEPQDEASASDEESEEDTVMAA
ncbi:Pre-rRNA-processing protein TSR1-like protein [Diplonema papillatum]|nr:Pre-rRNA-processing protein TSR1-like protein [Diplonema papillatum]